MVPDTPEKGERRRNGLMVSGNGPDTPEKGERRRNGMIFGIAE